MRVELQIATLEQSAAVAALRAAVADNLTRKHGRGHWSSGSSERGVLSDIRNSNLYIATHQDKLLASLRLETKKPWAIDLKYFSACRQPLYLLSMAVHPDWQRQGIGRLCLDEVKRIAQAWPADAIRLDAYDADAGAGEFYSKCGFREVGRASYRNCPLIYFEMAV
ncbi:MAG: hypothetical protein RL616_488 [Verrucomicrobiota bacterium]|jgi:ribosomal protein S18 acetylase RimI-like enzyme